MYVSKTYSAFPHWSLQFCNHRTYSYVFLHDVKNDFFQPERLRTFITPVDKKINTRAKQLHYDILWRLQILVLDQKSVAK